MNSATTKDLRIIVLLDGRPGHEKQTMGIIRALQEKVPVEIILIKVEKFSFIKSLLQTCRLYLPLPLGGLANGQIEKGDILIGTGSRTHLPILLYKKKYAIPAIICMTPALHLLNRFDLCFVPEHEGKKEEKNIMLTAGAPNCSRNKRKHRKECGLILLGGVDTKSHYWDSLQVMEMIRKNSEYGDLAKLDGFFFSQNSARYRGTDQKTV